MLAGVHQLHHEEVGTGTGSHLTAAHQEEQLLLKSCASLVARHILYTLSNNDYHGMCGSPMWKLKVILSHILITSSHSKHRIAEVLHIL